MKVIAQYYDRDLGKAVTVTPETPLPAKLEPSLFTHVEPIADPSNATVEEVANSFNSLLSVLKGDTDGG